MNKTFYKSLISIICLLAFLNIVTLILPVFSYAKVGLTTTSTTHMYGYELLGKLFTSQIKDVAMITFVISYIVLIIASFYLVLKGLSVIASNHFDSKTLSVYAVFTFILSLVFSVFVFVLVKQPNLTELLNETNDITYKAGFSSYLSLMASLISMIIAISIRKIAKKNKTN